MQKNLTNTQYKNKICNKNQIPIKNKEPNLKMTTIKMKNKEPKQRANHNNTNNEQKTKRNKKTPD